jgi:hypothetical protein
VGNDARFDGGRPSSVDNEAVGGDILRAKKLQDLPACFVVADNAAGADRSAEGMDVLHHVRCSAEEQVFSCDVYDRNWSFRRDARHLPQM